MEQTDLTIRKEETQEFFAHWDKRMTSINPSTLDGLFNQFTALFTGYNRLYNDAYFILKSEAKIVKPRLGDWEKAVVIPVDFIGAEKIIQKIKASGNEDNIGSIVKLMKEEIFAINLAEGRQIKEADDQLKSNLLSSDDNVQVRAILSLIYQIRNNMQHGEKHFEEYQRLLLTPVIALLDDIVQLLRSEMNV